MIAILIIGFIIIAYITITNILAQRYGADQKIFKSVKMHERTKAGIVILFVYIIIAFILVLFITQTGDFIP